MMDGSGSVDQANEPAGDASSQSSTPGADTASTPQQPVEPAEPGASSEATSDSVNNLISSST